MDSAMSRSCISSISYHFCPVSRLDRHTSGVLCAAKNRFAAQRLSQQMAAGEMHRTYCAVLRGSGLPDSGTYDGVHPAINVYDDMERILVDAVKKVLKMKKANFYTLPSDEADARKAKADAERTEKGQPLTVWGLIESMSRMRGGMGR